MARPRKQIDYELVEKLGKIHCTQEEIAQVLGMSVDTLQRNKRFNELYHAALAEGRMCLRRLQYQKAKQGNVTMLIWLGKQLLGQRDQVGFSGSDGGPVTLRVVEDGK